MKLSLGISPCPNDTFMFDAIINKRIDTYGLDFDVVMTDVEELNQKAFKQELDITKISYHAFAYLTNHYILSNSGSALGNNVGPLLVTKKDVDQNLLNNIDKLKIAIPGKYTTANFLLSLAFPQAQNKTEVVFSEIENVVLNNTFDAGLLIHENRFTYEQRGLKKIIDCGEFWQQLVDAPIPLGGIVVKRNLDKELQKTISKLISESVQYAFQNPSASKEFVKLHAQEMDEKVMQQHINLYVNDYSIDLGSQGKKAVTTLFEKAQEQRLITDYNSDLFIFN